MEALLGQAPATTGILAREQTVADLARELLKLSEAQLRSLHSPASAARGTGHRRSAVPARPRT